MHSGLVQLYLTATISAQDILNHYCYLYFQVFYKQMGLGGTKLDIYKLQPSGEFLCPFSDCRKHFSQMGNLTVHLAIHLDIRPFKCVYCDYSARQKMALKGHIQSKHRSNIIVPKK